jgi:hypothetical protein
VACELQAINTASLLSYTIDSTATHCRLAINEWRSIAVSAKVKHGFLGAAGALPPTLVATLGSLQHSPPGLRSVVEFQLEAMETRTTQQLEV